MVFTIDSLISEMRFDCVGSHKVSWRLLSTSVLCGIYRRFVLLLDVEIRFDGADSHKVRCRLLSASVSRGIYRRFLFLLDIELRFDCAGLHKFVFCFLFLRLRGPWGFCFVVRRHGFPAKGPGLDSRPVRASLFPFLWACLGGASMQRHFDGQHPKNSNSNSATIENKGRNYLAS